MIFQSLKKYEPSYFSSIKRFSLNNFHLFLQLIFWYDIHSIIYQSSIIIFLLNPLMHLLHRHDKRIPLLRQHRRIITLTHRLQYLPLPTPLQSRLIPRIKPVIPFVKSSPLQVHLVTLTPDILSRILTKEIIPLVNVIKKDRSRAHPNRSHPS